MRRVVKEEKRKGEETEGPKYHRRHLSGELPWGWRWGHSESVFSLTCLKDIKTGPTCPLRFLGIRPQDVRNSK